MAMVEPRSATTEPASFADLLFTLQLEVARKADELARARGGSGGLNLECWLIAEAEVLGATGIRAQSL